MLRITDEGSNCTDRAFAGAIFFLNKKPGNSSGQNLPAIASPPAIAFPPSPAQKKPRFLRSFPGAVLAAGEFTAHITGVKFPINPPRISKSHKSAGILGFQIFPGNSVRHFSLVGSNRKSSTARKSDEEPQMVWS